MPAEGTFRRHGPMPRPSKPRPRRQPGPRAAAAPRPNMVEMRDISKRFPGVLANDRVDLDVASGSIHALLGENGAGKSTLMHILSGLYRPDSGTMKVEDRTVSFASPLHAIRAGVGMVHQHFMLVETQTVAENVVLGDRRLGFRMDPAAIRDTVAGLGRESGLEIDPDALIWQLSVGERQRVEIVKMLHRGARLLILDEPTAVLTPQEADTLFDRMRGMARAGRTLLFISHKLNEVMELAETVTVMRQGRVVDTVPKAQVSHRELVHMMVGSPVLFDITVPPVQQGRKLLSLRNLRVENDRGQTAVDNLSLDLHQREILGVAGVAGNGQRELAEAITGLRKLQAGTIELDEFDVTGSNQRRMIDLGISWVPQDRQHTGTAPNLSIQENFDLKHYRSARRGPFLDRAGQSRRAAALLARYRVAAAGRHQPVRLLSGGNLQKVILARELSTELRVLVAESPTRGLDVGAIQNVHELLMEQRSRGVAILLLSEDLQEVLSLSDRVAVIHSGRIMGILPRARAEADTIGMLMAGVVPEDMTT